MVYNFSYLKGIDAAIGLKYSEQEDTYAGVLGDFHYFIDKNTALIEHALHERNQEDFVRELHKLKSSARLIGATGLSERALNLEMLGRTGDWQTIEQYSGALLEHYREFKNILRPFARERVRATGGMIDPQELEARLYELKDALAAFDYDRSMEIIARLDERILPDTVRQSYEKMRESTESFEFEDAENYVNQMLK